ncbi:MAG TPA: PAS domain-containing protein, partial [Candidatus Limnocylindrales bacterium]|nr:PAS domain-containing protein [Candidatus Limnocylindrales bacterium]
MTQGEERLVPGPKQSKTGNLSTSASAPDTWRPRMRPVIDALEEAVLVADAQGCLVLFNAAAEEMYGAKLSPQTGKLWEPLNIYLPDQPDPCPADLLPLRRAVRGELVQGMEVVLRHEGGERWLSISGRPLLAENGALEGGISIVRDISARKQSERALV